jgi:uncharacterized protein DUF4270
MTINNFLRKERIFYLSSFLAIISMLGCQKQPVLTFGSSYLPDNASADIVRVDTTTVLVSTVYTDSTRTANTGYLQIGNLNDPYFGKISSRAFLQVAPPASLPSINVYEAGNFDSVKLIMLFKKGNPYYGDTTLTQTYQVNQVDTFYRLPAFSNGFWSNYSFSVDPAYLGQGSARIFPNVPYTSQGFGDSLKIDLPKAFGQRLYNQIYNNSDSITNTANFLNWFNGLCISSTSQGAIYGFRDSAIMRLYYHTAAVYPTIAFIDFGITNKSYQFNNITTDFTGTPLAKLKQPISGQVIPPTTLSDTMPGRAGYINSMLGMEVKLTFPYINTIALRQDFLSVVRAELTVQPVQGTFNTTWFLPSQLAVGLTDLHNEVITSIPGPTGAQFGNLVPNYSTPLSMIYSYDITPFIKTQITSTSNVANQNGVMLYIPPGSSGLNSFVRTTIADRNYPVNQRVTLSIYYISLFPHN